MILRSVTSFVRFAQYSFGDSFVEIMLKQVTLEKAIDIVRLSIALSFCWPLPPHSSRAILFLYKITRLFATISIISLLLPLVYAMYIRSDDIEIISLCLSQVILMMQGIIQTIICSNKHDTLQVSSSFHFYRYACVLRIMFWPLNQDLSEFSTVTIKQ